MLGRAVPTHFRDPFGLALRLLRSGSREARFAMASAAAAVALAPLDLLLARAEARRLAAAAPPRGPILLVTGPPRSGTTLLTLALIRCLPVAYFDNLTAIFPHAPITARHGFGRRRPRHRIGLENFYGRTAGLAGPNDALPLWDRWLGADRTHIPRELAPGAGPEMAAFFGAFEAAFGSPLVAKNNNLIGCADLVAPWLPGAHFVCLRRDPLFLAQSLLEARRMIHGDLGVPYGIDDPARPAGLDPIADVVRQLRFYDALAARQRATLGARFEELAYETFCAAPLDTVLRIAHERLGLDVDPGAVRPLLPTLTPSRRRTLAPGTFARLERAVADAQTEPR
jgi:hypothetical protein